MTHLATCIVYEAAITRVPECCYNKLESDDDCLRDYIWN